MTAAPRWARLLAVFLFVAGLRDFGLKAYALATSSSPDPRFMSWQLWFVLVPGTIVGILKCGTAVVAWRRPRRCRFWFTIMTLGIATSAALQSPLGGHLSVMLHGGPSLTETVTGRDLATSIVSAVGGVTPYVAVTIFFFVGSFGRWFGEGESRRRTCARCGAPKGDRCPDCGARVQVEASRG